jgi:polyisoprenoid-binding protein YceI
MTLFTILSAIILNLSYAATADFRSVVKSGKTNFEAVGRPAMIKIKGESHSPNAKLAFNDSTVSLEADLDLNQLSTGIDLRDDHMKNKYLEVSKFPSAKLIISTLKIPVTWATTPSNIEEQEFEGMLTLRGKTSPVRGKFKLNDKQVANAQFIVKLSDFNIEIPNYLGITVAENVTIDTQIQFEKK